MLDTEIARFRSYARSLDVAVAERALLTKIDEMEAVLRRLGREPQFQVGGSVSENIVALNLHHWRRRVAEAEGRFLPPDAVDELRRRLDVEKARMAAEVAAKAKRDAEAAEREVKARQRREARRAAAVPKPKKAAAPTKPPAPKSPPSIPGQLDLF